MANDQPVINANPTRALFVHMLTKDVDLDSAILDLIDNSVDAARELAGGGSMDGYEVRLTLDEDQFVITDTCGGMSIADAAEYAFRFGRPEDVSLDPRTIGRFGVGMKRSLFKLGRKFEVVSTTDTEFFRMTVDVAEWVKQLDQDWSFSFAETRQEPSTLGERRPGLRIVVSDLYKGISESFRDERFRTALVDDIQAAHQLALHAGLKIFVNDNPVLTTLEGVIATDAIHPAVKLLQFGEENELRASVVVGVGKSDPNAAGWYVYCNDRLILRADQTNVTGWKERAAANVPAYHNQYSRFRGFLFFESQDPARLPFNTTKTGLDLDNAEYRKTRTVMVRLMLPVLKFLNDLDKESEREDKPLTDAVEEATGSLVAPFELTQEASFIAPEPGEATDEIRLASISYKRKRETIEAVKERLKATSNKEVGEETFDYYLMMEMND